MAWRRRRLRDRPNHIVVQYGISSEQVNRLLDEGKRVEIPLGSTPDAPSMIVSTVAWIQQNDPEWFTRNGPDVEEASQRPNG
jgi:hypothetical protein